MSSLPVLLIAPDLAADAGLPELQSRLRLRGAAWSILTTVPTVRSLLAAMREANADPGRSWLATRDRTLLQSAATAGLCGIVVVGAGTDADAGILLRHSPDLPGVTIAMVPRGGGCWHA